MKNLFSFNKGVMVVVGLILFFSLIGCSNNSSGSGDNGGGDKPVKLTLWLWTGTGLEDQIEQFNEENDDIEIDVQTSEFAAVHTNLTTALAAGSGAPDISLVEVKGINKYKTNPDNFYNLFDLGADEIAGDYLDWKWKDAQTPDGQYQLGIPTDIGPIVMAYNKEIFEAAGLPTDRDEVSAMIQTWDDYIELGRTIKAKTGSALSGNPSRFYSVIEGQGDQKYYDKEGNIIVKDNAQLKKAYDSAITLIEEGLTLGLDGNDPEWITALQNGDFATFITPAWDTKKLTENAPDSAGKWDMTSIPGGGNMGGSYLTIPKQSEYPEEAYEFIKWILSPEQQIVTFKKNGNFPSTPSVYNDSAITELKSEYFNNAPVGSLFAKAAEGANFVVEGPDSISIEQSINDAITRVVDGQASPEESWQMALDEIERLQAR
ncbi:ABC transporter substrate-binding protein [Aquibacillus salsiterrae]|uniref:Extracellular solute-binding protein n=1 Tax=Aquibacillus salsiterrae TaxID=2950439 RepID=A0A9X3WFF3_9BACI|nr:extracellular solute-binding protein [Aquibacillus salsiterrae]MDC3416056.1 extracellular solute-binding protein [Aquibacillus salsiterrae]